METKGFLQFLETNTSYIFEWSFDNLLSGYKLDFVSSPKTIHL